jgi:hypothetical protein
MTAFSGRLDDFGQQLQMRRVPEADESTDLVRILTELTQAAEGFDSMVGIYRKALEQQARPIDDWSEQITLRAADMATFARQALEQLRRLGEPTTPA